LSDSRRFKFFKKRNNMKGDKNSEKIKFKNIFQLK